MSKADLKCRVEAIERRLDRLGTTHSTYRMRQGSLPILGMFETWYEAYQFGRWYLTVVTIATAISLLLGGFLFQ